MQTDTLFRSLATSQEWDAYDENQRQLMYSAFFKETTLKENEEFQQYTPEQIE